MSSAGEDIEERCLGGENGAEAFTV